ncbi:STAS domain-containing protein [Kitasatospora sp. NPDC059571]|uniref:STAS domain-containing protein n=1 Tax=Kitasatospora sp. NPDC059571 TaxID=3346871 RepID=UPI003697C921
MTEGQVNGVVRVWAEPVEGAVVVGVGPVLGEAAAQELVRACGRHVREGAVGLALDLSDTAVAERGAVQAVADAFEEFARSGVGLAVFGAEPTVEHTVHLAGVSRFARVWDTREETLAAWNAG